MLRRVTSITLTTLLTLGTIMGAATGTLVGASASTPHGALATLPTGTLPRANATPAATPAADEPDINYDVFTRPLTTPNYVAIGDSYAIASFALTTIWEPCFRNLLDYPHLTSAQTGLPLVEPACIGGSGSGYWYSSKMKGSDVSVKHPYRELITKQTELVTINLGLNDIMLAYNKKLLNACLEAAYNNEDPNTSACRTAINKDLKPLIDILPRVLEGIYKDAKKQASPNALIVGVGYVEFFHGDDFCWDNMGIGPADRAYINTVFRRINTAIKQGAKKARIAYYIPGDHQVYLNSTCGLPFLRWTSTTGLPEAAYPLHPTFSAAAYTSFQLSQMYRQHRRARRLSLYNNPLNVIGNFTDDDPQEGSAPTTTTRTSAPTSAPTTTRTTPPTTQPTTTPASSPTTQ